MFCGSGQVSVQSQRSKAKEVNLCVSGVERLMLALSRWIPANEASVNVSAKANASSNGSKKRGNVTCGS